MDWYTSNNIKLHHSPAWHPQSNGLAERHVQDIKMILKRISSEIINPNRIELLGKVQGGIIVAQTQSLDFKSQAEMMFNYKHRTLYNSLYHRITQRYLKNDADKDNNILPAVNDWVWVKNQNNRLPSYLKAQIKKNWVIECYW